MTPFSHDQKQYFWGFGIVAIVFITGSAYSLIRMNVLSSRIDTLTTHIESLSAQTASTTEDIRSTIDKNITTLADAIAEQEGDINSVRRKLGNFEDDVDDLSGTLGTLQKLAKTDPELLKKYSKAYFLNENYVPARLSEIPKTYQYSDTKQLLIHSDILDNLTEMIDDASSAGVKLYVSSAYRSFAEQRALKSNYQVTYGAGTANTFSADQGYSEHQLGTTVDMLTPGIGGVLEAFDGTAAYQWMLKNAHKYGFILSYPKGNAYYIYEPWHWRYVGVELAEDLFKQKKNFYDLEQRAIDEYLVNIFD